MSGAQIIRRAPLADAERGAGSQQTRLITWWPSWSKGKQRTTLRHRRSGGGDVPCATLFVGAAAYALLSPVSSGGVAPDWGRGLACGTGGLVGGYLGARLPECILDR